MKEIVRLMHTRSKKQNRNQNQKHNTSIYFITNYRREIKLAPVIMDYCPLQFDTSNLFLGVRLHGGLLTLDFQCRLFKVLFKEIKNFEQHQNFLSDMHQNPISTKLHQCKTELKV